MKRKQVVILIFTSLLAIYSTLNIMGTVRQGRARFISEDLGAATEELQKSPPGFARVDHFIQRLKSINTTGAPADVKQALANYIAAMDQAVTDAKVDKSTPDEDKAIAEAKQTLLDTIKRSEQYSGFLGGLN